MPDTVQQRRDAYQTAIDTILADAAPNSSAEAYGIKYTRHDLTKLEAIVSKYNAILNRRQSGMMTYADVRGRP